MNHHHRQMRDLLEQVEQNGFDMEFQFTLDESDPRWINIRMRDRDGVPDCLEKCHIDDLAFYGRIRYLGEALGADLVQIESLDQDYTVLSRWVMEADPDVIFAILYVQER